MADNKLAPTKQLASKVIYAALNVLKDNNNELPGKDVVKQVAERVPLTEWDKEIYTKTGYVRWQSILHFFTIDCLKAGYLLKKNGVWYLTPEGDEALTKYNEIELLESATKAYKQWKKQQPSQEKETIESDPESETSTNIIAIDEIEQLALESIEKAVNDKGPYEMQDLVAALLRGMGFFTPFIAPRGKDGGVDVIAYKDPLGTTIPRIKVQVKHRENSAGVKEIRELIGILQKNEDVGIFVSTGGFASDAKTTANNSQTHIELIDLTRFINLWREFYPKLEDDDKNLLPLKTVSFLAPAT